MTTKIMAGGLLLLLASSCSFSQKSIPHNTDSEKWNLKGHVKSIKQVVHKEGHVGDGFKSTFERTGQTFLFNERGDLQETITRYTDGRTSSKKKYYDNEGHLVEQEINESDGIHSKEKVEGTYDAEGRLIEQRIYFEDGSLSMDYTCRYNSAGNRAEELFKGYSRWEFEYHADGTVKNSKRYTAEGDLFGTVTYHKYDDGGNVLESQYDRAENGTVIHYTYAYEYDKMGNWLKLTQYENGVQTGVTERELEYYP